MQCGQCFPQLGGDPGAGRQVRGVLGVPVVLGQEGWTRVMFDEPAPDEVRRLAGAAAVIDEGLAPWGLPREAGA